MSTFGEVNRNAEFACGDSKAGHVVRVLVGDDDGVEGRGIFVDEAHAAEEFAAAEASVDENPGIAAGDDGAIALGTRRQHRESHHEVSITREPVHYEVRS